MTPYNTRIVARLEAQEQKGIHKYGQILEENHGGFEYRLDHFLEELADAARYGEWLRDSGKIITTMFELLAQDMEAKLFCPLETPCAPDNLKDGGCVACLKEHYEKKARERIGI